MSGQHKALTTIQINESAAGKEHSRALFCQYQGILFKVRGTLPPVSSLIFPNKSVTVCK